MDAQLHVCTISLIPCFLAVGVFLLKVQYGFQSHLSSTFS